MQMRHCLIKYAQFCIFFFSVDRSEPMIKSGAKFFFPFCLHTRWKKKFRWISGYSMLSLPRKSKYTVHILEKSIFAIFLWIKYHINQAMNDLLTNPSEKIFRILCKCITGKFGVHTWCTGEWQKTNFEKKAFKI